MRAAFLLTTTVKCCIIYRQLCRKGAFRLAHLTVALSNLWRIIVVFFSSFLPFCESKGSIVLAHMLHLRLVPSGVVSATGAFVPVPFILKGGMTKNTEKAAGKKAAFKKYIEQYGCWALLAMTAIPCTGVGTWLAAILARVTGVDKKKAAAAIFVGNCIATFVMVAIVAGVKFIF